MLILWRITHCGMIGVIELEDLSLKEKRTEPCLEKGDRFIGIDYNGKVSRVFINS